MESHTRMPHSIGSPPTAKKRRACEPCRSLKSRCLFDNAGSDICRNCSRFKRRCVVEDDLRYPKIHNSSGDRLGQHNTENSSSESGAPAHTTAGYQGGYLALDIEASPLVEMEAFRGIFPFLFSKKALEALPRSPDTANPSEPDVIDRGLLDLETALELHGYFVTQMVPRMPFVAFYSTSSSSLCRETTPVLFLAILMAAAGGCRGNLQLVLLDEFYKIISYQVVYQGQKRIELAQAILIAILWMPPPERIEDAKFGIMTHLATSIMLDLRLKAARLPGFEAASRASPENGSLHQASFLEGQRTVLGCFCTCSMLALIWRRPTIFAFDEHVSQSLKGVQQSREALGTDKSLVAWVELQRISIELLDAKCSIPNGSTSSSVNNVKSILGRTFESRLLRWKNSLTFDVKKQEMLWIEYHSVMVHANLLGVSDGRPSLVPPFTEDMISPCIPIDDVPVFTKCIASARTVLDTFVRFSPADMPSVPGFLFPRIIHAMLILIVAASVIVGSSTGESQQKRALRGRDVAELAIIEYCERIVDLFLRSRGPQRGRNLKAGAVLALLKKWVVQNTLQDGQNEPGPSLAMPETTTPVALRQLPMDNLANASPDVPMDRFAEIPALVPSSNISQIGQRSQAMDATAMENASAPAEVPPLGQEQFALFDTIFGNHGDLSLNFFDDAFTAFEWM